MKIVPIIGPDLIKEHLINRVEQQINGTARLNIRKKLRRIGIAPTPENRLKCLQDFVTECASKEGFGVIFLEDFPLDQSEARYLVDNYSSVIAFEIVVNSASDVAQYHHLTKLEHDALNADIAKNKAILSQIRLLLKSKHLFEINASRTFHVQASWVANRVTFTASIARREYAHIRPES